MFSDDIEIEISLLQNVSNIGVGGGDGEGGVGGYCSSCYGVGVDVGGGVGVGGDGVGGDGVGGDVGGRYLYLPKSWQGGEGGEKKVEDWTRGFLSIFSLEAMTLPLKVI